MDAAQLGMLVTGTLCSALMGALLAAGVLMVTWGAQKLWAWIDDQPDGKPNVLIKWTMIRGGWKLNTGAWRYQKDGSYSDGSIALVIWLLTGGCLPVVVVLSVFAPWVPVTAVTVVLLVFLSRFARRTNKVLKKHMDDPNAHK